MNAELAAADHIDEALEHCEKDDEMRGALAAEPDLADMVRKAHVTVKGLGEAVHRARAAKRERIAATVMQRLKRGLQVSSTPPKPDPPIRQHQHQTLW